MLLAVRSDPRAFHPRQRTEKVNADLLDQQSIRYQQLKGLHGLSTSQSLSKEPVPSNSPSEPAAHTPIAGYVADRRSEEAELTASIIPTAYAERRRSEQANVKNRDDDFSINTEAQDPTFERKAEQSAAEQWEAPADHRPGSRRR